MTNRNLTALILRVAGIYLFSKVFDHFGSYFFSVYGIATLSRFNDSLTEPIDKIYFSGTCLVVVNFAISLFLFIKADWISKKIIKTNNSIVTELNPKSLTKVILSTVGIVWLAESIYSFPNFIDYATEIILKLSEKKDTKVPDFPFANYILKTMLGWLLIFRIEKISDWILKEHLKIQ